jgi:hypothetical protein
MELASESQESIATALNLYQFGILKLRTEIWEIFKREDVSILNDGFNYNE